MRLCILKGCHYSTFLPKFHKATNLKKSVSVSFNENCLYKIDEKSCVNKLWGFACNLGIHKNSFRFGWTSDGNLIYIWIYVYINGILTKQKIGSCCVNTQQVLSIEIKENRVIFQINEKIVNIISLKVCPIFFTELGFYFGGNSKAPHKMWIDFNYEK